MKRVFPGPLEGAPEELMNKVGYQRHCFDNGRVCYHRRIHDPMFPRFHAFVRVVEAGLEIDVHFDQLNLERNSDHQSDWAYEGGRVSDEMDRIMRVLRGVETLKQIPRQENVTPSKSLAKPRRSIFDILFR